VFINICKIPEVIHPFNIIDLPYKETGMPEEGLSRQPYPKGGVRTLVEVPARLINPSILSES